MSSTILVVADLRDRYGRDVLDGIDEATRLERWRVIMASGTTPPPGLKPDGVIGFFDRGQAVPLLRSYREQGIPVVELGTDVIIDEASIGGCAAQHFLERGLVQGACVTFSAIGSFNTPRCAGFRASMPGVTAEFDLPLLDRDQQLAAFVPWLRRLPKPIGIFAANDYIGQIVLDACHIAQIAIPEQASLVGVDNDHCLCLSGICPMSSVCMPHRAQGAAGAVRLLKLIAHLPPGPCDIVRPGIVRVRASSDFHQCADDAVSKALGWIRHNFAENVSVDFVAKEAGVNRRTLERRFRNILRRSVHDEVRRVRILRAQELLSHDSQLPIAAVATAVGLSLSAFGNAFHIEVGCSPGAWRIGRSW